jgi:hypothetical protein
MSTCSIHSTTHSSCQRHGRPGTGHRKAAPRLRAREQHAAVHPEDLCPSPQPHPLVGEPERGRSPGGLDGPKGHGAVSVTARARTHEGHRSRGPLGRAQLPRARRFEHGLMRYSGADSHRGAIMGHPTSGKRIVSEGILAPVGSNRPDPRSRSPRQIAIRPTNPRPPIVNCTGVLAAGVSIRAEDVAAHRTW